MSVAALNSFIPGRKLRVSLLLFIEYEHDYFRYLPRGDR